MDPRTDGNLRLAVISTKNNQVVDGHWAVKWVNKLVVKAVGQVWTLDIEGAIADKVDRGSFESCGSPSCHGLTWTDDSAQVWAGVPFWRLVGQVDDENNHGTGGFNVTLADKGYTVDVIAKDGYTVTLDSKNIKLNDDILLAYMVNDTELPEKYFPLRLVGKGLEKSQMAGQIAKIVVKVPATAAPTETSAPTMGTTTESTGSLVISGLVTNELKLGETELRAMGVADITAEHPKKGKQNYSGVRLSQLLIVAQVKPEATRLVLTASDGYSAEIDLAAVRGCPDCMIAFTDTPETFILVMPGLESSTWVKNIAKIEVK
ncbi:MAG: hypothetical protein HGA53_05885 [Anaerolineaceae bacterium]|nr:hypothetical protein [Anaerolineaceae bacterium]